MGGWGKIGGGGRQNIAVCRLMQEGDQATISLDMKYHFMEGIFCHGSALL